VGFVSGGFVHTSPSRWPTLGNTLVGENSNPHEYAGGGTRGLILTFHGGRKGKEKTIEESSVLEG